MPSKTGKSKSIAPSAELQLVNELTGDELSGSEFNSGLGNDSPKAPKTARLLSNQLEIVLVLDKTDSLIIVVASQSKVGEQSSGYDNGCPIPGHALVHMLAHNPS
ncbi:hypothetical protein RDI58_010600 [Solanum bulbocastanum]|uniref:Uncharacterized protein n=1 Tax=Solanum bulbocastanum TaxID=147425 RepID=A0AAN8TPR1_SOLBU